MLESIILISPKQFHDGIIGLLKPANPDLFFYPTETLVDLSLLDSRVLRASRLISFLNTHIVPQSLLEQLGYGAVNFHPGPPSYPGHAPFSFALYKQASAFGTTAHLMSEKVDDGSIISIDRFSIPENCQQRDLVRMCIKSSVDALASLAVDLTSESELKTISEQWGQEKTTKQQYADFCEISPDITADELTKRLRAFGSGDGRSAPNVTIGNTKYFYDEEQNFADTSGEHVLIHGNYFRVDH